MAVPLGVAKQLWKDEAAVSLKEAAWAYGCAKRGAEHEAKLRDRLLCVVAREIVDSGGDSSVRRMLGDMMAAKSVGQRAALADAILRAIRSHILTAGLLRDAPPSAPVES